MTDERMCAHPVRKRLTSTWVPCGHAESAHEVTRWNTGDSYFVDNGEEHEAVVCVECGNAASSAHPFEAAPSTDEGEARPQDELWDAYNEAQAFYLDSSLSNHNVRGAIRDSKREAIEAAIRAPLERDLEVARMYAAGVEGMLEQVRIENRAAEERIRELEAARDRVRDALPEMLEMAGGGEFLTGLWAQRLLDSHNRAKDAEAEVERLREALRWAYDQFPPEMHGAVHPILDRALATPPSSTEGTKEVEG